MLRNAGVRTTVLGLLTLILVGSVDRVPMALQIPNLEDSLGKWVSAERFEGEPRISVSFRKRGSGLEGWAILLGQHRKNDDRATLALSFSEASWDGRRVKFNTILPEDEGTIGWELRVITPITAVLAALTEDGLPVNDDDLRWDMSR
jgi:hypothetical protein